MGIDELVAVLKKEVPDATNWQLNHYPNENYGSLHLKAISNLLNDIFKGFDLDRDIFYSLKNGTEVINYYNLLKDKYDLEFLLPWYSLSNITYF